MSGLQGRQVRYKFGSSDTLKNELLAKKRFTHEKLLDPNVKNKVKLGKLYKSQKEDLQK